MAKSGNWVKRSQRTRKPTGPDLYVPPTNHSQGRADRDCNKYNDNYKGHSTLPPEDRQARMDRRDRYILLFTIPATLAWLIMLQTISGYQGNRVLTNPFFILLGLPTGLGLSALAVTRTIKV